MDTKIRVGIFKDNECVYESVSDNIIIKDSNSSSNDEEQRLKATLKETQQRVNQFLTTLVDEEQNQAVTTKDELELDLESGSDDDSTEERNSFNPKKSKFSTVTTR